MKSKKTILVVLLLLVVSFGFGQEKTRKQLIKERKIEMVRQTTILKSLFLSVKKLFHLDMEISI